jgi:hypothetical protein
MIPESKTQKPRRKNKPGAGRPAVLSGGRRVEVWLDAESVEIAQALGNGNLSAGLREALKMSCARR